MATLDFAAPVYHATSEGQMVFLADKRACPPADLAEGARLVTADFERDDLRNALLRAGLDPNSPAVVVWDGARSLLTDSAVHESFCALARTLAADSRVIFRYLAGDGAGAVPEPAVLAIDSADLEAYLGVRGFALLSDIPSAEDGYRIAVAKRRADRKSCCRL